MKIKLFLLVSLSSEVFSFMSPQDMMDRMTMKNAKSMMLMPLHPEQKMQQGIRLMQEASHLLEYEITHMSQKAQRSILPQKSPNLR